MKFSREELATLLAALRFYQEYGMADRRGLIHSIATDGDTVVALDAAAIDDLATRLNSVDNVGPHIY